MNDVTSTCVYLVPNNNEVFLPAERSGSRPERSARRNVRGRFPNVPDSERSAREAERSRCGPERSDPPDGTFDRSERSGPGPRAGELVNGSSDEPGA